MVGCVISAGRRIAMTLLAWAALAWATTPVLAQESQLERAVKATYLYKFAPFVEWPDPATEFPSGTFNICVVGEAPFGALLDRAVEGQSIAGRSIAVQRLANATGNPGCSVLYVSSPDPGFISQVLASVRGTPILTVTDGARDAASRGIVNFVIDDNRVRFEIDDRAAAANKLTISSKLLGLATNVIARNEPR